MKIDWKVLAASTGYRSFKKAFIQYKIKGTWHIDSANKTFKKIIGLAQATTFAECKEPSLYTWHMDLLLGKWEKERSYCWLNYYLSGRYSKPHSNSIKKKNLIKYYSSLDHNVTFRASRLIELQQESRKKSGKKARWNKQQKAFYAVHGRL
jgi:hypothetical protein